MARETHLKYGTREDLLQAADNLAKAGYGKSESREARLQTQFYLGPETEDPAKQSDGSWMLIWESE